MVKVQLLNYLTEGTSIYKYLHIAVDTVTMWGWEASPRRLPRNLGKISITIHGASKDNKVVS